MEIHGTGAKVSYGDQDESDWRGKPQSEDSDHDEEPLSQEEKDRLKEKLGFDYEEEEINNN